MNTVQQFSKFFLLVGMIILCLHQGEMLYAQVAAESEITSIRLGRFWVGVAANGAKASFNYVIGYFPNDYDIMGDRGVAGDAYGGMGFLFSATNWRHYPDTTLYRAAVYGPTNDFMPQGNVITPLTSYVRYPYPVQTVDYAPVGISYPGVVDPTKLTGGTYDHLVEVTTRHVFNVDVQRKIMAWSQSLNDNYVIVDVELTNVGTDTLNNFYVNMMEGNKTMQFSSNNRPPAASGEMPLSLAATWMHYYGAEVGDSLRLFYEYNANTSSAGDNMGAPAVSQGGRLMYSQMSFYTILHASYAPYYNAADDSDDFAQPKVTYIGNATKFPSAPPDDEFGSTSFYTIRGGYADDNPREDTTNLIPGTHHGLNNDDRNNPNYADYRAGISSSTNDQKKYSSFGPYTFLPGQKLHFVYASGVAGIGLKLSKEVGEKWLNGTLENPPNMPDADKGWLPAKFAFPANASEMDKRKDRWISMGIDSVFRTAARAKWNHDHNYNIPAAPPPPSEINILGSGGGVQIKWRDVEAEAMSNFNGYRIMRRLGTQDTMYFMEIYSSDATDKADEHTFIDTTARIGALYYYYVQAKAFIAGDDLTADPASRGETIFSSRVLIPTINTTTPLFPPQDELSKIRITPNPYNISDPRLDEYGWTATHNYGLLFVHLPSVVTIRIFTENGDLILEHKHEELTKSGLWRWDLVSRNQQVVNSGVYIALFEKPDGARAFQKFIIVR